MQLLLSCQREAGNNVMCKCHPAHVGASKKLSRYTERNYPYPGRTRRKVGDVQNAKKCLCSAKLFLLSSHTPRSFLSGNVGMGRERDEVAFPYSSITKEGTGGGGNCMHVASNTANNCQESVIR